MKSRESSILTIGIAAVGAAILAAAFAAAIRPFGRNIPQPNIETDYALGLLTAAIIGVALLAWPLASSDKTALLRLWGAKCVVTLGLMLVYEWNYGLDAYFYFGFATTWATESPLKRVGFGDGAGNVTALASLIADVVPSYHAIKVVFSLFGLIAVYVIYRAAVRAQGREDIRILYLLGLFPSILFWSSILGKDPLQLLCVAVYAFGVVSWSRARRLSGVLLVALGILGATSIRIWSGPILLVPLIFVGWSTVRSIPARGTLVAALLAGVFVAWTQFSDKFKLDSLDDLRQAAENLSTGWGGGSAVQRDVAFTSVGSMIAYAPTGMFTALFRPIPGDVMNAFGMLAGIENAFLLFLVAKGILNWKRAMGAEPLVRWALALVLCWALVYAFVAYNLGSVVRFKLQILPIFLLLLMYVARRRVSASEAGLPDAVDVASPA